MENSIIQLYPLITIKMLPNLFFLCFFQFSQNNRLKEKLTGTYPKILVEASPVDTIWGIGCANDDPAAWDQSTWRGKNYLGFVLTEVRDELLCDAKFITPDEKKVFWCIKIEWLTLMKQNLEQFLCWLTLMPPPRSFINGFNTLLSFHKIL